MNSEEVILNIEGNNVKCRRDILISNSEYFKVMLEGKFIEGSKDVIPLYDVDLKAFKIILSIIEEKEYPIPEEDLLIVLQTASMLQFEEIRDRCIYKLTGVLSPENCFNIWRVTELLTIEPLYLKAKYLALSRFEEIKDQDCLLELNIKQLYRYLSNTKLCCDDEYTIFDLGMKWYRLHSEKFGSGTERIKNILFILSCIDFNRLSCDNIDKIKNHECISQEKEIVMFLDDILKLKNGNQESVIESSKARRFLTSRHRQRFSAPCIVGHFFQKQEKIPFLPRFLYDKHWQSRAACILRDTPAPARRRNVLMYHVEEKTFKNILTIPEKHYMMLQGYHMLGYKQFVYMLGGEFQLGRGSWYNKVWICDTINGNVQEINLPIKLRHFEACIASDNLYIIGGTTALRLRNPDVYCFNLKNNIWTTKSKLGTCSQNKCCDYRGNLLVINLNEKNAYIVGNNSSTILKFEDTQKLVKNYPLQYTVFSNDDFIYIKGSKLIKLQQVEETLVVVDCKSLKSVCCDRMESVICNKNTVFTLYKQSTDDGMSIILEQLHLQSSETEIVIEHIVGDDEEKGIEIGGTLYYFSPWSRLFNMFHYSLAEKEYYISDYT